LRKSTSSIKKIPTEHRFSQHNNPTRSTKKLVQLVPLSGVVLKEFFLCLRYLCWNSFYGRFSL